MEKIYKKTRETKIKRKIKKKSEIRTKKFRMEKGPQRDRRVREIRINKKGKHKDKER